MEGNPAQFEVLGTRLGFRVGTEDQERLRLIWHGVRFPAFLCLGVSIALLFLSIPILEAIRQRGFEGPASFLWYFPLMNLILLGISLFLLSLKRTILFDHKEQQVALYKRSIFRSARLSADYDEVTGLKLGIDEVYSGFALAGSSAAQKYPAPSLRLILKGGETVLLDRGSVRRLESLGKRLSYFLGKPLLTAEALLD